MNVIILGIVMVGGLILVYFGGNWFINKIFPGNKVLCPICFEEKDMCKAIGGHKKEDYKTE